MGIKFLNEEFPATYYGNEDKCPKFDGTDIINVDRVKDIPNDYLGEMGVPITFVDKYNSAILPFKILSLYRGWINGKEKYIRYIIQRMNDKEWEEYVEMMEANKDDQKQIREYKLGTFLCDKMRDLYIKNGADYLEAVEAYYFEDTKTIKLLEVADVLPPYNEVLNAIKDGLKEKNINPSEYTITTTRPEKYMGGGVTTSRKLTAEENDKMRKEYDEAIRRQFLNE